MIPFVMIIINLASSFILAIGYYHLFYKLNRPAGKGRSIALLVAVIVSFPFLILVDTLPFYLSLDYQTLETVANNISFFIPIVVEIISLLPIVLLGASRSRMVAPAAFAVSLIHAAMITVNFAIRAVIYPLLDVKNALDIPDQFPYIFCLDVFFVTIVMTGCCLLAARWLRDTPVKPPSKWCGSFSLGFIVFAIIINMCWVDIRKNETVSFLAFAFLGVLLLGILFFFFYVYTRLIGNVQKTADHAQLSKREMEVIEAVVAGNTRYKEIADHLSISVNTVKFHLRNIYKITGTSNIPDLLSVFQQKPPQNYPDLPQNYPEKR